MTVAEIGSGWGAFAIHIAPTTGARVTAINVSPEQIRIARERAAAAGVGDWSSSASSTTARSKAASTGWCRSA